MQLKYLSQYDHFVTPSCSPNVDTFWTSFCLKMFSWVPKCRLQYNPLFEGSCKVFKWLRIAVALMRQCRYFIPVDSVFVSESQALERAAQTQHKQVVVVVWLSDRGTTRLPPRERGPIRAPALAAQTALQNPCLCSFPRSYPALKSAALVLSMFRRKGADDVCSIVWGVFVCVCVCVCVCVSVGLWCDRMFTYYACVPGRVFLPAFSWFSTGFKLKSNHSRTEVDSTCAVSLRSFDSTPLSLLLSICLYSASQGWITLR